MSVSLETIEHLARLARLELTPEEKTRYQKEMAAILDYVKKLEDFKAKTVSAPLFSTFEEAKACLRDDEIKECPLSERKKIIEAFPEREDDLAKIKGVFENRKEI